MAEQLRVMISSTARDLPEHRKQIVDACLRQNMFPLRMEDLAANSDEAAEASLKMVEDAGIYIGVFANRYGYVPKANNAAQISVTEMEYNRAVDKEIERLIFVMDKSHPITVDDVEIENAAKLKAFKERVGAENIVRFFKSPDDLRAEAINSLSKLRQPDLTAFHYVSDIPAPPEEYIAHPYTLLQTHRLIGRKNELGLLTDWVSGKELPAGVAAKSVRIMSVIAIGGMGKSALTWRWFKDVAPQEMKPIAGRMWWSFYESDATFENFVARALAYATRKSLGDVQQISAPERETQLLAALDREPFLIVLDGLERILIAYARMEASRLDSAGKEEGLRKAADPRAGSFLRKLAQVKHSRILISSRLYPADIETDAADPIPGTFGLRIEGMSEEDSVELWRAFGVSGSRDELLPVFMTFDRHPLLIQALAGEVKRYRKAPANFAEWRKANPQFDPSTFPRTKEAMGHVLEFALHGLDERDQKVLQTTAAFQMPTSYDTLAAVLVGESKACASESELDAVLNELDDRGLIGWDKRANRYDLHPIVRGVVWGKLTEDTRRGVYSNLQGHFAALPMDVDWRQVNSIDQLTPAIELYHSLIGLGKYDEAAKLFEDRLMVAVLHRLNASREFVDLLTMLFPDGLDQSPRITNPDTKGLIIFALAFGYQFSGRPQSAAHFFRVLTEMDKEHLSERGLGDSLGSLSGSLFAAGALRESESVARSAFNIVVKETDRGMSLAWCFSVWGMVLASRGEAEAAVTRFERSIRESTINKDDTMGSMGNAYYAQLKLWQADVAGASTLVQTARELAQVDSAERDLIRTSRLAGTAALLANDFTTADDQLHRALVRARTVNLVDEELPALVALGELRRRLREFTTAREFLEDVWEPAARGPYPLIHADALNVLAQIEADEGHQDAAIGAATKAYRLAWCDGPPFAYHWGLERAKQHLQQLGAPEPQMPPFDESKFDPMPEAKFDPEAPVGDKTGQ